MENRSPLELLPCELIWSIIEQAPEAVGDLRLSSSTLRTYVDQYALERATIGLVDELQVNSLGRQACVDVKVEVPGWAANLFELRLRLRSSQAKRILKRFRSEDRIAYYFTVPSFHPILRALSEAAGMHIDRLALARYGPVPLAEVDFLWDEKSFRKLSVQLEKATEEDAKYVQKVIIVHEVDHMTWNASEVGDSCDTAAFLSEIATHVRTLYIFHIQTLRYIAWAPLIHEMLSRKLDKLHLSTTFHRSRAHFQQFDTISTDCATALIETLPKIRKRFHFSTAFTGRLGVTKPQRPFICRIKEPLLVGAEPSGNRMLIISHWSRIDEDISTERKFDGTSFDAYFS